MIKISVDEEDVIVDDIDGDIEEIMTDLARACITVIEDLSCEISETDFQEEFAYGTLCRKLVNYIEESLTL